MLLASCLSDKIKRNMPSTINMAFAYQLQMNFLEAIHCEECTGQLTYHEPSVPIVLCYIRHNRVNIPSWYKS